MFVDDAAAVQPASVAVATTPLDTVAAMFLPSPHDSMQMDASVTLARSAQARRPSLVRRAAPRLLR